ncbi:perlucin-like protein isoform X1 [Mytilus edulis]|uniref:perlucin-like protein isoform X1 n=1 Tax=Mytilus edulis TaxID=6550 RepID=UPI0039EEC2AB
MPLMSMEHSDNIQHPKVHPIYKLPGEDRAREYGWMIPMSERLWLKCLLCCLLLLALNKGSFQYKIYITQNEKNLISNARTVLQKLEKILNGEKLCSQGWEEYKEHCYRFNTKLIKWHEAEIECRKQEGYLLKIEDANEFRWIVARAKAHSVHNIWIGLRKKNNKWKWVVDEQTARFQKWNTATVEPSGDGPCVHMCSHFKYNWNDVHCSMQYSFVCEQG